MTKIVVGLGFGDEGKGTIVDFLTREAESPVTVVRFNGGGQAAHNVVTPRGQHHTFAQFGSGTLAGARTLLSRFVLVDPISLLNEAIGLQELLKLDIDAVFKRLSVDKSCLIVTPFHAAANRIRETLRGNTRHGSCGMGIHETVSFFEQDAIYIKAGELWNSLAYASMRGIQRHARLAFTQEDLDRAKQTLPEEVKMLDDPEAPQLFLELMGSIMAPVQLVDGLEVGVNDELIFEGAQGVLLDEKHGFFPYVTHSTTTFDNALTLLEEGEFEGEITKIGVTRPYLTRHGRGPFPGEDAGMTSMLEGDHNAFGEWQEGFRVGHFDYSLIPRVLKACGKLDFLAVTCLDHITEPYGCLSPFKMSYGGVMTHELDVEQACERLECSFRAPILIRSYGKTWKDKVCLNLSARP